ncbi:SIR2 family NAD-dependent protein deacylase [Sneathiella sp. HT1-7]|uniref:SIR2 family NAD-dependent protein deacylase n=1 Tax=Sneathiella sp. HT1-7 TaxID=2887192 RepID=UPI001D14EEE3|nr:Sir2 family NAD-dependent protein deacetylase [Sneathiella sp. HT1-7]MCC3305687.1 Sir2 family NAD-dependent protein deacetylase [Sneathiella sp. HT1-7]
MPAEFEAFAELIENSQSIVIFTGAGISTESGIPDFRSPGGLWEKNRPIEFSEFLGSEEARRESWRRKFAMESVLSKAKPNKGHMAISSLYDQGKIGAVITQNIDGLHQASGIRDEDVIEVHGNTTYAKCLDCGTRMELSEVQEIFSLNETLPICEKCGGIVKTATISFGQAMPVEEMRRASAAALTCDLLLAIGSSLVVYPAAEIPLMAKQGGAELVILNREPTPLDSHADIVLNREIGETLAAVTKL